MPKIIAGARFGRGTCRSAVLDPFASVSHSLQRQSLGESVCQLIRICPDLMPYFRPLMRCRQTLLLLALLSFAVGAAAQAVDWPLWENFRRHAIQSDGRVIERRADDRTTSEAQAYALFFALVANDRGQFDRLLSWTQNNLANGDLRKQQPAFLRGVPLLALGELSTQQSVDSLRTECRLPKIAKQWSAPLSGAQTHRCPA